MNQLMNKPAGFCGLATELCTDRAIDKYVRSCGWVVGGIFFSPVSCSVCACHGVVVFPFPFSAWACLRISVAELYILVPRLCGATAGFLVPEESMGEKQT